MSEDQIFMKVKPRSIEDDIFANLREAIVGGQIKLGEHLNESDIAKQMEVSRIPVREVLRKLEQEGLVDRIQNKGCFVKTFTNQDVKEVFSMRASLESMSFEWAIPNITSEDIKNLEELISRQEKAVQDKDYDELTRLDMHFHEYICIKAEHSRLLKAWYQHHAQCQMLLNIRFRHLSAYTPESVLQDHGRLLDSIKNKDVFEAIELTHQISKRVSADCIKTLEAKKLEAGLS